MFQSIFAATDVLELERAFVDVIRKCDRANDNARRKGMPPPAVATTTPGPLGERSGPGREGLKDGSL